MRDAHFEHRLRWGRTAPDLQAAQVPRGVRAGNPHELPRDRADPGVVPKRVPLLDIPLRQHRVLLRVRNDVPRQGDPTQNRQLVEDPRRKEVRRRDHDAGHLQSASLPRQEAAGQDGRLEEHVHRAPAQPRRAKPELLLRGRGDLLPRSGAEPQHGLRQQGARQPDLRPRQRPAPLQLRAKHGIGRPVLRRRRDPRPGTTVGLHVQRRRTQPALQLHAFA